MGEQQQQVGRTDPSSMNYLDQIDYQYYNLLALRAWAQTLSPFELVPSHPTRSLLLLTDDCARPLLLAWLLANSAPCACRLAGPVVELQFKSLQQSQNWLYSLWGNFKQVLQGLEFGQEESGDTVLARSNAGRESVRRALQQFGRVYSLHQRDGIIHARFDRSQSATALKDWRKRTRLGGKDHLCDDSARRVLLDCWLPSDDPLTERPSENTNTNLLSSATQSRSQPQLPTSLDSRHTLMVRNIPNSVDLAELTAVIDSEFAGCYDFLYLPQDRSTGLNLGYAFINLLDSGLSFRFRKRFQGLRWHGSQKVTAVCFARIQGRQNLVQHFSRRRSRCEEEY